MGRRRRNRKGVREEGKKKGGCSLYCGMLPAGDIRRVSDRLGEVALLGNYRRPGQSHCLR